MAAAQSLAESAGALVELCQAPQQQYACARLSLLRLKCVKSEQPVQS